MRKFVFLLPLLLLLLSFECKSNSARNISDPVNERTFISDSSPSITSRSPVRMLANDAAIEAAFTLDYRPLKAEPVSEYDTLSAADLAGSSAAGTGLGVTVGGGLRKLSDYQTVYFDPAREQRRIEEIRA
ncbi:MAG: hypothetical protein FWD22_06285, partial [Treponema sp.]|nr:hypothetical protein [Treponema sp.]